MDTPRTMAAERLGAVRANIAAARGRFAPLQPQTELVAVSKTFPQGDIVPFLEAGQRVFGENRVQEAKEKWPELRVGFPDVQLHLVGPLQTNKVKEAVALFDVIETLDRERLAEALSDEIRRSGRDLALFVQVNIGLEEQKSGIAPDQAVAFVERCRSVHGLNISGLMCIPPAEDAPGPYFAHLASLGKAAGVSGLSMGMSSDYEIATAMGATHVRVGSALFGQRAYKDTTS
jgi:pyridoxal phosphate enzyme (YggS family)